jgi:hypothetical protein
MPVLHRYADKESYYVLTSIKGNIITFQISRAGEEKLLSAGILPNQQFSRALLLDLYRTGDAFTHGSGPGAIRPPVDDRQLALDFANDPEPETLFPACSSCASINDLHLVEIKDKDHYASLLCDRCRVSKSAVIDSSLPLPLVTRSLLSGLIEIKSIAHVDDSVITYKKLLDAQFATKWETAAKTKSATQGKLFGKDERQGNLL